MKKTGIARKTDKLGRLVIPVEARRNLGWDENTLIDIFQFGHYILLHSQEDSDASRFQLNPKNPVVKEISALLGELTDSDMLLVLSLAKRLSKE